MRSRHVPTERQELRPSVREEPAPDNGIVVVRGGLASHERLLAHAHRTHGAFTLDGEALWGISVFCALDDIGPASLDALLRRFASYRVVHLPSVGRLRAAEFDLLPTFRRPHFTVVLGSTDDVPRLCEALGAAEPNPYHGQRPGRR
jgi:hypothetical protein